MAGVTVDIARWKIEQSQHNHRLNQLLNHESVTFVLISTETDVNELLIMLPRSDLVTNSLSLTVSIVTKSYYRPT